MQGSGSVGVPNIPGTQARARAVSKCKSLRLILSLCYNRLKVPKVHPYKNDNYGSEVTSDKGSSVHLSSETGKRLAKRGRNFQTAQLIILPFIPIVALIIQNILGLQYVLEAQKEVEDIDRQVNVAADVAKLISNLQWERSEVAFYIFLNGTTVRSNLTERFKKTDKALNTIVYWPEKELQGDKSYESKEKFQIKMEKFRSKISPNETNVYEVIEHYTQISKVLLDYLTNEIKETNSSEVWRFLLAYKNLLRSVESFGISIVYGINYFGRGELTQPNHIQFIRHDIIGHEYLNSSLDFASTVEEYILEILKDGNYTYVEKMRIKILLNDPQVPNMETSLLYFNYMTNFIDTLVMGQRRLRIVIRATVRKNLANANYQAVIGIFIVILVLCVSPIIIILVLKATSTIKLFAENLIIKADELKKEKMKSDRLLFQMLPPSVAIDLKQKRQVQAQSYEDASIYFSDIVGFTEIAAGSTPLEVVVFLNSVYRLFDSRIESYDVYKVETIGDAYMVASGLPKPNGGKHVTEIASMALDLVAGASLIPIPHRVEDTLKIRVGLHCGAVVAGIVGTRMPRYCLFGDTVNTASRMESTGEPMKVHISLSMKKALDNAGGFHMEYRGLIEIKGKGLMDTYWLIGKEEKEGNGKSVEVDVDQNGTRGLFDEVDLPEFMHNYYLKHSKGDGNEAKEIVKIKYSPGLMYSRHQY